MYIEHYKIVIKEYNYSFEFTSIKFWKWGMGVRLYSGNHQKAGEEGDGGAEPEFFRADRREIEDTVTKSLVPAGGEAVTTISAGITGTALPDVFFLQGIIQAWTGTGQTMGALPGVDAETPGRYVFKVCHDSSGRTIGGAMYHYFTLPGKSQYNKQSDNAYRCR